MSNGPGKYDAICTLARELTEAEAIILIVLDGVKGTGISVQAPPEIQAKLPLLLRLVASEMQRDNTH